MMPGMPPQPKRLGRPQKIETVEELTDAFESYQAWRTHPDQLQPIGNRKKPRLVSPAPSLHGFAAHVGISRMTLHRLAARSEEFNEALNLIRDAIGADLIAAGVIRGGTYDSTAALKVAGVTDKVEVVSEPKPTETASQRAISDASLSYHPDDTNLEGPLMPLAAIRAGAKWPPENVQIEGTTA